MSFGRVGTIRLRVTAFAGVLLFIALAVTSSFAQSVDGSGVPVRLDGKEVFRLHSGVDQLDVAQRAALVEERLYDLALNPFRPSGDFSLRSLDGRTDILFGDRFVVAVTDADAAVEGMSRPDLAASRLEVIRTEVNARRATYWKPQTVAFGFAVMIVLSIVMWFAVGFARRHLAARIAALSAEHTAVRFGFARALAFARTGVLLAAVAIYFVIAMFAFPRSRFVAIELADGLVNALATVWKDVSTYAPNLLFLVVIGALTWTVVRLARYFFSEVSKGTIALPGFDPEWAQPTHKIVAFLLIALALVMAFPYLPGSQSRAFQGVSLFLGLLLSMSSSSAISNLIAGVILTYTGAFRMGDRVKIADAVGDIVGKTLLVTRVRTNKNVDIAIPNALVLTSQIINYSRAASSEGAILHTSISIGYDAPWRRVHELLIAAAAMTEDVLEDPKPFVQQTSLDDFYVTYEINVYTRNPWRTAGIKSELHQNIMDQFNEAGVEIMSPHFAALREGNRTAIPESYLPEDYEAPSFRIPPK